MLMLARVVFVWAVAVGTLADPVLAQWTHRYPRVSGYGHHVYLEGYELPTLNAGPMDPAPSPDGARVALAARGWIWILDLSTGIATRVTSGGDLDSRPAWSPDGARLAFVRDNDHETSIVEMDLATRRESVIVSTPAIDLDPAYSPDGRHLYYSSAVSGDLGIWRLDRSTLETEPITSARGIELRPQVGPSGRLVYLAKGGGRDQIRVRDTAPESERVLREGSIASMARPALSPDGEAVAVNWPTQDGWELRILDVANPGPWVRLTANALPLTPAWSSDGRWIYFSEPAANERMNLMRVAATGGPMEPVPVRGWEWGGETGTLRLVTRAADGNGPVPARVNVVDERGHPAVPDTSAPRFDGQLGRVFFYSEGVIDVTVPTGRATVSAVSGLTTPEVTRTVQVEAGDLVTVDLDLEPVWNARAAGWTSGEHHFHLNYGGPYDLDPSDLVPMMRAENLDVATPLLANLHNRFEDQDLWTWRKLDETPLILFGQEVRSHFLGHVGLVGISDLFWPWVWGPGYQVYGTDDRPNTDPLRHARAQGGMAYYVHPVAGSDPFEPNGGRPPVELIADAVLGDLDALEVVCLWSDDRSTAAVWHRLLNLGIPVVPSAGTDVMNNFYRTMAVGTARVYAYTGNRVNWPAYLDAFRAGRSFVTNGPMLDLTVEAARPGGVVSGDGAARWNLVVRSAVPVERVDLLVNGAVVETFDGLEAAGVRTFDGSLDLPAGGWIAARADGGRPAWPSMAIYPFAHTAPVWIDHVGSVDPEAERTAAQELLHLLDAAEVRLREGYGSAPIPRLSERFAEARAELESRIDR